MVYVLNGASKIYFGSWRQQTSQWNNSFFYIITRNWLENESLSMEDFNFSMKSPNLSKILLAQNFGTIAVILTETDKETW